MADDERASLERIDCLGRRGHDARMRFMPVHPGNKAWPAAMIVWGPLHLADCHHCVQLVMTMDGSLRVRGGSNEAWRKCGAALVRPDTIHEGDARGSSVLVGFIDANGVSANDCW